MAVPETQTVSNTLEISFVFSELRFLTSDICVFFEALIFSFSVAAFFEALHYFSNFRFLTEALQTFALREVVYFKLKNLWFNV